MITKTIVTFHICFKANNACTQFEFHIIVYNLKQNALTKYWKKGT